MSELALYAVRNKEGKWFRRKGYGGYGETWVDDFRQARIYNRIGPARGVVSFFANTYPDYGIPDLVKLVVSDIVVVDETKRVEKQRKKKQEEAALREERQRRYEVEEAQRRLEAAQRDLQRLRSR